jgi:transposase
VTDLSDVTALADTWRMTQADADAERANLIDLVHVVRMQGVSEYAIADAAGVSRVTVRSWLGKGKR